MSFFDDLKQSFNVRYALRGNRPIQHRLGTSLTANPLEPPAFGGLGAAAPRNAVLKPGADPNSKKGMIAGRTSRPSSATMLGKAMGAYLPRRQALASVQKYDLSQLTPEQLVEVLSDSDPAMSMGVWNTLRSANSGWTIQVKDGDDEEDDPTGMAMLDETVRRINRQSGGMDTLANQLHWSGFLHGAICAEAPPLPTLSDGIEDIYPVAPWTIRFKWENVGSETDPEWVLAMQQYVPSSASLIWLSPLQVFYLPLDPAIDDPYGRSPAQAACSAVILWLEVMRDFQRNVHVAAWGRADLEVVEQTVTQYAPQEVKEDDAKLREWVRARVQEVINEYAALEPDDAFVHLDSVKVSRLDLAGHVFDVAPLFKAIEGLVIRGMKQLPTLMGGVETRGGGTIGTLEYAIYATGIAELQRLSSRIFELAFELDLRLRGRNCRVHFIWESIRTTDRLKDAQAKALEIQNVKQEYFAGWISQEEASLEVTGHEPDLPEPRPQPAGMFSPRPSPPPMDTTNTSATNGVVPKVGQPTPASGGETDQQGAPKPSPNGRHDLEVLR